MFSSIHDFEDRRDSVSWDHPSSTYYTIKRKRESIDRAVTGRTQNVTTGHDKGNYQKATSQAFLWDVMCLKLPKNEWLSLSEIYEIVETNIDLLDGDQSPDGKHSTGIR